MIFNLGIVASTSDVDLDSGGSLRPSCFEIGPRLCMIVDMTRRSDDVPAEGIREGAECGPTESIPGLDFRFTFMIVICR